MTQLPDSASNAAADRKRILRTRNIVLAVILAGFAILTFAISIAKMG
jgi:hypothetical protein